MDFNSLVTEVIDKIQCMEVDILAERYLPVSHQSLKPFSKSTGLTLRRDFKRLTITDGKKRKHKTHLDAFIETVEFKTRASKRGRKVNSSSAAKSPPAPIAESPIRLPGTWVECCLCHSWRYLPDVHDPSQLPVQWCCALRLDHTSSPVNLDRVESSSDVRQACKLWPSTDQSNNTSTPNERLDDFLYTQFAAGSLVWAKVQGYPYWPAMVYYNAEGRYAEFDATSREATHYYVVFLDPIKATVSRVATGKLRKFTSLSNDMSSQGGSDKSLRVKKYYGRLRAAAEVAEEATRLPVQERIAIYGYDYEAEVSAKKPRKLDPTRAATSILVLQPHEPLASYNPHVVNGENYPGQGEEPVSKTASSCLEKKRADEIHDNLTTVQQEEPVGRSPTVTTPKCLENTECGLATPTDFSPPDSPSFLRPQTLIDDSVNPTLDSYQSPYPSSQSPGFPVGSGTEGSPTEDSSIITQPSSHAHSLPAVRTAYIQRALDDFASFSLYTNPSDSHSRSFGKLEPPAVVVPWSVERIPFHLQLS